ncbi:MAG: hypothetical protein Q9218_006035, partial [Villophora microphyllina]
MSPSLWHRSTSSGEQQAPQQSSPSAGSNSISNNTRPSSGSDTSSIHDVEAAFLPEQPNRGWGAQGHRRFRLPFVSRKAPSSADSFGDEDPKRALRKFRWATVVLSIVVLA